MSWIDFREKFPDKELKEVLTFEMLTNIATGEKIHHYCVEPVEELHMDDDGVYSDSGGENITHWMPLPARPANLPDS